MPCLRTQSITPQVIRDKKGTRATFAAIWCRSKRIMECHLGAIPPSVWHFAAFTGAGRAECAPRFCIRCNRSATVVNYLPVLRSKSIAGWYREWHGVLSGGSSLARWSLAERRSSRPDRTSACPDLATKPGTFGQKVRLRDFWICVWETRPVLCGAPISNNFLCERIQWLLFLRGYQLVRTVRLSSYLWLGASSVNCC